MPNAKGVVAAGHKETAQAAADILRAGGNAYDAVLAGLAAACVAEPLMTSLGGGGFLMADPVEGRPVLYDFFTQTPSRTPAPEDEVDFYSIFADFGSKQQEFHTGLGTIAIPGTIRGLFEIHKDLCTLPMREIFVPAIALARSGVRVNAFQAFTYRALKATYSVNEDCLSLFGSGRHKGELLTEGERHVQPELAAFFEALADEGPDLFYKGAVATQIAEAMRAGGVIHLDDLSAYEVLRREPLDFTYRRAKLHTNPPPSSGGLLIAFSLKLLEQADLSGLTPQSLDYLSRLVTVMAQTGSARAAFTNYLQDPSGFLHPDHLARWREDILSRPASQKGTTHISVIDAAGNMAGLTSSNGEGSGHVPPGTGIVLNNMLGESDLNPDGARGWPPGVRLTSMMAPTLLHLPDGRRGVIGSAGSNRLRTSILQMLVHLIDFGLEPEVAVNLPRLHLEGDHLDVEAGLSRETAARLVRDWPDHHLWPDQNMFFGGVQTALFDGTAFSGSTDPRRAGACITV